MNIVVGFSLLLDPGCQRNQGRLTDALGKGLFRDAFLTGRDATIVRLQSEVSSDGGLQAVSVQKLSLDLGSFERFGAD